MSDRAVFVPFRSQDGSETYDWADVVIAEAATTEEVHRAARSFASLAGPHKVFVRSRTDPRFLEFVRYLDEEHAMVEGADWGFSVRHEIR